MDIHEVLEFVDKAVYANTGKYLNDLQQEIIKGTLKQMKYPEIADSYGCTAGHAKDVGYELWKMLSNIFEKPLNKKNLKAALERKGNLNIWGNSFGNSNMYENGNTISYIKLCPDCSIPLTEGDQQESSDVECAKERVTSEATAKLQKLGLSDEQIQAILAEVLNLVTE
jgi:hypothetical protein